MGRRKLEKNQDYVLDLIADMRAGIERLRDMGNEDQADGIAVQLDKLEEAYCRTLSRTQFPGEGALGSDVIWP